MSGIIWLASYPKSGNTWLRVFLANFVGEVTRPVDINGLESGGIASSRELFGAFTGVEGPELHPSEIERLRPRVYRRLAEEVREKGDLRFIKVHDAFLSVPGQGPLFPPGSRVLYIIRNPLDVAVSFAHFMDQSVDRVIRTMADEDALLAGRPGQLHIQLRQRLRSWSGHVESWLDESGLEVEVLRYEDMKAASVETFTRAVRFAGLDPDSRRIRRALEFASFEEMRRQERARGFRERGRARIFFRKGEVGGWRDELTPDQVRRIVSDHEVVMARFGYLPARDGTGVFGRVHVAAAPLSQRT